MGCIGRSREAKLVYEKLVSHPNQTVRKKAGQLLFGFQVFFLHSWLFKCPCTNCAQLILFQCFWRVLFLLLLHHVSLCRLLKLWRWQGVTNGTQALIANTLIRLLMGTTQCTKQAKKKKKKTKGVVTCCSSNLYHMPSSSSFQFWLCSH